MQYDVLIIGAGAAGLIALKELAKAGYNVCMLEASSAAGGRIATIEEAGFAGFVETGPEFIHGNLDLTFQLLNEAGITAEETVGEMYVVQKGNWQQEDGNDNDWEIFIHCLLQLKEDTTIERFLQQYFDGAQYTALRERVKHYAEGFDLADISKASALFVRDEWKQQEEPNYRIKGGYKKLIAFLEEQSLQNNASIFFDHVVYKIEHTATSVTAYTINGKSFQASKIIITAPPGVLQDNSITFLPTLNEHAIAIKQLGFGAVIKVLLQFKTCFWETYADDIGFILSNETIPTWWTQLPNKTALLTGWLGGPPAAKLSALPDSALLQISLQSLAVIFNKTINELQQELVHHKIICWQNNPYIKGGYSYNTIASTAAKKVLVTPVNNTIFFAGEAYYTGASQGTVEAALQSGLHTAKLVRPLL